MLPFKAAPFPKEVILFAVFFPCPLPVSYCELEGIMAEGGV
jgi:putative transposase